VASERALAFRARETLERQRQEAAKQAAEAQLRLLQAQIEPHFLLNTLGNIRSLVKRDGERARDMLDHLVDYLLVALPRMRQDTSTLGHELELSTSYLAIMQIRMGARLAYHIDCPAELLHVPFPPMLLQTLVENAIKHGLEPSADPGTIAVQAGTETTSGGQILCVAVTDTGVGFGKADTGGTRIGLANIRERLQSLFGGEAELIIAPNLPNGVIATLRIPRPRASEES
jgi:sensor histidine kinase YesM